MRITLWISIAATLLNAGVATALLTSDSYSMGMNEATGRLGLMLAALGVVASALAFFGRRLAWLFLALPLISGCFEVLAGVLILIDMIR